MPTQHCQCGAKYRFAESAIGKRAKCKKCGVIFTIEPEEDAGPIPLADDEPWDPTTRVAKPSAGESTASMEPPPIPTAYLPSTGSEGRLARVVIEEVPKRRRYLADVLRSFVFVGSLGNLFSFIGIWVGLYIARFIPCFGWIVVAWYSAFRFKVVASAAAGEDDLPMVAAPADFLEELIYPLLRWLGTWIVVLLPAIAYFVLAVNQGWLQSSAATGVLTDGLAGTLTRGLTAGEAGFIGLICAGVFVWPMVVLCVAIGGFQTLHRFDLMVATVSKTFPAYLGTVALVFAAYLFDQLLTRAFATGVTAAMGDGISNRVVAWLLLAFVATGVSVYFEIVALRVIGLYYYHFKHRFAWSWE